jgi:hypothetical protein
MLNDIRIMMLSKYEILHKDPKQFTARELFQAQNALARAIYLRRTEGKEYARLRVRSKEIRQEIIKRGAR